MLAQKVLFLFVVTNHDACPEGSVFLSQKVGFVLRRFFFFCYESQLICRTLFLSLHVLNVTDALLSHQAGGNRWGLRLRDCCNHSTAVTIRTTIRTIRTHVAELVGAPPPTKGPAAINPFLFS